MNLFLYNRGSIETYLENLVVPLINGVSLKKELMIHVLSSNESDQFRNLFSSDINNQIKHEPVKQGKFSHFFQLVHFIKNAKKNKVVVLTENQAILVGLIKLFFFIPCSLILYKQGALAEEKFFLTGKKWKKIFFKVVEKFSLFFSNEMICVSHKMEKYYREKFNYKKKCYVINNKVLFSGEVPVSLKRSESPIEIVYSGSLSKWQNIDYILQLFVELQQKEHLCFKLITRDSLDYKKYPIKNITVTSSNPSEIINELSKSDIGIIIRDDNILNVVSSPLKIGEYLTAGLSVILTPDIGDYSELISSKELGVVVSGNNIKADVEHIYSFVKKIQSNKDKYKQNSIDTGKHNFCNFNEFLQILN